MKISIGTALQAGPYGGGNQFARALAAHLAGRSMQVSFDLRERDLDIILLTEPRGHRRISAYTDHAALRYLLHTNAQAMVVHRLNTSDDGHGATGVNRRLAQVGRVADYTVYVSRWLQQLYAHAGASGPSTVIRNAADPRIFHADGHRRWTRAEPLRIVTHHWSNNARKGFDVYARLDAMLAAEPFRDRVHFTFIGRLPDGFRFQNATHLPPLPSLALADELRRHHVYLTAARDEAGANHPMEGASCGLPLLYRRSGCLPEYCDGLGLPFDADTFPAALEAMLATYDRWAGRGSRVPAPATRMGDEYVALFERLLDRRHEVIARRHTTARMLVAAHLPDLPLQRTTTAAWRRLLATTLRRGTP